MKPPVGQAEVSRARALIDPVFLDSPVLSHNALDTALGCVCFLKIETLNPIRSFKGRGSSWFAQSFADKSRPVICASAGNFGQGVAYAGTRAGLTVKVVAATNANPLKLDAMRNFGAEVILHGHDFDAAKLHAAALADKGGGYFLEDGREPAISEGAGTIAVELLQ